MLTGTLPRLCGSFRLRLASTFNHRPDSPAALIIPPFQSVGNMFFLQKIIYVSCFFACHVGSAARENLFCVFYGIILNLPVLHRMLTNAVSLVLSFILKGCLFFRFCFIPHMPDFAKTASAGMLNPKALRFRFARSAFSSAEHSDYKSAKIGCQALRRIKFRQFYENTLKNLRIRGKLWNIDKTNAVFKPVTRFSAGRIRPMQCRCAVRCAA